MFPYGYAGGAVPAELVWSAGPLIAYTLAAAGLTGAGALLVLALRSRLDRPTALKLRLSLRPVRKRVKSAPAC